MLRQLFCGLLLGIVLLTLCGCGQSATSLSVAATVAAPAPAATHAPASTLTIPPAEFASAGPQIPTEPTASESPTDRPKSIPAATALPTAIPASPSAERGGDREMLRGVITALDGNGLKLDVSSERIYMTATTQVLALTKPLPATSLTVGRSVVVQAARNAQGQLVAERISFVPRLLHQPLPPSK